jgi:cytidine deaminase
LLEAEENTSPETAQEILSEGERNLLQRARDTLGSLHKTKSDDFRKKHFVLALVQTESGKIFQGLNLKTQTTRASVCAESVAIANALAGNFDEKIVKIVIVMLHPKYVKGLGETPSIASPCGICRELLLNYASEATVIVKGKSGREETVPVRELLPHPYKD